jgi:hypothetical protein
MVSLLLSIHLPVYDSGDAAMRGAIFHRYGGTDIVKGGLMGSFVRRPGIMAGVLLAGAALTAAAPAAAAQAMTATPGVINVPCSTSALATAITTANGGGAAVLVLAGNCSYDIQTPATASDGLPLITGHVSLVGGKNTVIRRSPAALTAFRVLDVAAGATLRVANLSIRNGSTAGLGGGIQNAGSLWVSKVMFSGNQAGNGGALSNSAGATATLDDATIAENTTTGVGGGGILNSGTLTLSESSLSGNHAPINGGGLNTQSAGISHISQSQFVHNVSGGLGGAISNLGTTTLYGTSVRFNKGSGGGGIATGNTNVTLTNSTVTSNTPDNCSPLNTIQGCVN